LFAQEVMTRVNFHLLFTFWNICFVFETTDIQYESLFLSEDGAIVTPQDMLKHGAVLGGGIFKPRDKMASTHTLSTLSRCGSHHLI
jgi:hypothetical protein